MQTTSGVQCNLIAGHHSLSWERDGLPGRAAWRNASPLAISTCKGSGSTEMTRKYKVERDSPVHCKHWKHLPTFGSHQGHRSQVSPLPFPWEVSPKAPGLLPSPITGLDHSACLTPNALLCRSFSSEAGCFLVMKPLLSTVNYRGYSFDEAAVEHCHWEFLDTPKWRRRSSPAPAPMPNKRGPQTARRTRMAPESSWGRLPRSSSRAPLTSGAHRRLRIGERDKVPSRGRSTTQRVSSGTPKMPCPVLSGQVSPSLVLSAVKHLKSRHDST